MTPSFCLSLFSALLLAHVAISAPCQERFASFPPLPGSPPPWIVDSTWPYEDLAASLPVTSFYVSSVMDLALAETEAGGFSAHNPFVVAYLKGSEDEKIVAEALLYANSSDLLPVPMEIPLVVNATWLHTHALPNSRFAIVQGKETSASLALFEAGSTVPLASKSLTNFCDSPTPGNPGYFKISSSQDSAHFCMLCFNPEKDQLKAQIFDLDGNKVGPTRILGSQGNQRNIFDNGLSATPAGEFFVAFQEEDEILLAIIDGSHKTEEVIAPLSPTTTVTVGTLSLGGSEALVIWKGDSATVFAMVFPLSSPGSAISTASCPTTEGGVHHIVSISHLPNGAVALVWTSDQCPEYHSISLVPSEAFRNPDECFPLDTPLEAFSKFRPSLRALPSGLLLAHFTRPSPFTNHESDWGVIYLEDSLEEVSLAFPIDNSRPHQSHILVTLDDQDSTLLIYPSRSFDCPQAMYQDHWKLMKGVLNPLEVERIPTEPPWANVPLPGLASPYEQNLDFCVDFQDLFNVASGYSLQFLPRTSAPEGFVSSGLSAFNGHFRGSTQTSTLHELNFVFLVGDGFGHSANQTLAIFIHNRPPELICFEDSLSLKATISEEFSHYLGDCFSDSDSDELIYETSLANGGPWPDWLHIYENLTFFGVAPNEPTDLLITVVVHDGHLGTLTEEVRLDIVPRSGEPVTATTTTATTTTTEVPIPTTAEPITTEEPIPTTAEPITTEEPVTTTAEPITTTQEPVPTTVTTTEEPVITTTTPVPTVTTTAAPTYTTEPTSTSKPPEEPGVPIGLVVTLVVIFLIVGVTFGSFVWRRCRSTRQTRAYRPIGHQSGRHSMIDDDYELQELNPFNH